MATRVRGRWSGSRLIAAPVARTRTWQRMAPSTRKSCAACNTATRIVRWITSSLDGTERQSAHQLALRASSQPGRTGSMAIVPCPGHSMLLGVLAHPAFPAGVAGRRQGNVEEHGPGWCRHHLRRGSADRAVAWSDSRTRSSRECKPNSSDGHPTANSCSPTTADTTSGLNSRRPRSGPSKRWFDHAFQTLRRVTGNQPDTARRGL